MVIFKMSFKIETERLILREFTPDDAKALIAIADQPHIGRWLPDWKGFVRWAPEWIEKVRRHYKTDNPESSFISLAVELKGTNELIGHVNTGGTDKGIGVGYFISENYMNQGYITEAMEAFIGHIFQKYGYDHLIATVQPGNQPSNRVVQKLGFVLTSTVMMLDIGQTEELPFHIYRLDNPYLPVPHIEEMADFFNSRADIYDSHMLVDLNLKRFYDEIEKQMPSGNEPLRLLDLGCGTGLELERVFAANPAAEITAVDLSENMLARLKEKFPDRQSQLRLICGSYFDNEPYQTQYDFVLSTYSLHHISTEAKLALYQNTYGCLRPGGIFINGDYTVKSVGSEQFHLAQSRRICNENGVKTGFYHYDCPLTAETETRLLTLAGFTSAEALKEWEHTTIFKAVK